MERRRLFRLPGRGEGPVDLVYLQGFLSNVGLNWEHPAFARFARELSRFSRLIVTDRRGLDCGFIAMPFAATYPDRIAALILHEAAPTPGGCLADSQRYGRTDVRGVLPSIQVPTLVLHRSDDPEEAQNSL
ncbi:MAG: alpha/beta fold hydrolase [Thermoleophilaceae bacterium]